MAAIRFVLGKIILFLDWLFQPKSIARSLEDQRRVDVEANAFVLYQFEACPFCVKVRRASKRLGLSIETRDILKNKSYAEELTKGGGEYQVPCLRIQKDDGSFEWMYESSVIIEYLNKRFSRAA
jgi:glutaredoxin